MKLIRIGLDRQAEVQAIKQARASTEVVTRKSGSDGCAACWKPRALRDSFVCPPSHPLLSLSLLPPLLWNPLLMEYNELVLINGVLRRA